MKYMFLHFNLLDSGQFLRLGYKILMFGDETWLKLFPESFHRSDGVSSFYVTLPLSISVD